MYFRMIKKRFFVFIVFALIILPGFAGNEPLPFSAKLMRGDKITLRGNFVLFNGYPPNVRFVTQDNKIIGVGTEEICDNKEVLSIINQQINKTEIYDVEVEFEYLENVNIIYYTEPLMCFNPKKIKFLDSNAFSARTKEDLLEKVRNARMFEYEYVLRSAKNSEFFLAAKELITSSSDKEVLKLLNDGNPIVRSYAAYFVQDRNIKADWYNYLAGEIEDYEKVLYAKYDVSMQYPAGDFIIQTLIEKKLSKDEQKKLRVEIIKKQSKFDYAEKILCSDEKSDDLYKATKEWAKKGNETAIYALAKYQKSEDLALIETLKTKTPALFFRACEYNRIDKHKPYLKEYMISIMPGSYYSRDWIYFYKLIADYHDDFSKEIFDMAFSNKVNKDVQKYHIKIIYYVIKDNTDGFYDKYIKIINKKYDFKDEFVYELQ